jgi:hypothetical protein|tara:strand:- start:693 stop:917 length:225 start_codon:yes stop_codon:yes gene_type:complete
LVKIKKDKNMDLGIKGKSVIWGQMHNVLSPLLNIQDNHIIHCGISLGWEDEKAEVNKLRTVREDINNFTTFHEK